MHYMFSKDGAKGG